MLTNPASEADASLVAFIVLQRRAHGKPLRLLAALGDDVDDAVDGIGSPQSTPGPTNDFDAVNVFQAQVVPLIPIDTPIGGVIDRATVNQHQHFFVGKPV